MKSFTWIGKLKGRHSDEPDTHIRSKVAGCEVEALIYLRRAAEVLPDSEELNSVRRQLSSAIADLAETLSATAARAEQH